MKHLLTLFLVLLITTFSFAQFGGGRGSAPSIVGKISGKVIDQSSGDPVEFATVVLQLADFAKDVDGVISDEKGKFALTEIKPGTYNVVISFIGYQDKTIKDVTTTKKKPDIDLGEITLAFDEVMLNAVEITETGPLLENKPDRLVYNAEADATNSGGDAADVLRKVPMLSVDLEGKVSLRGSQNIRVLLNGKPSSMFSDNLAEALKAIPSDQIKKVEVITSPSAKYEGEGSGGIINIITKDKKLEGIFASVNASLGTRQNNAGLTFNAKKGRLGFTSSGYSYYSWPADATTSFLRETFGSSEATSNSQIGSTESNRLGFFGKAGLEYDINAYNSLQSTFSVRGFKSNTDGFTDGTFIGPTNNIIEDFRRSSIGGDLRSGYDWSTNYTKSFKKKEQELSLSFRLDGNISNTDRDVERTGTPITSNVNELLDNESDNLETTFSLDYTHPFTKGFKMEVGTKAILRDIDSDYKYNVWANGGFSEDPARSNIFNYDQDVVSGYASFNINLPKDWSIVTGVRYEQTKIEGQFRDDITPFDEEYDNWFPNFNISKRFKDFSSIKFGWSNRIQRPSLFYINPFVQSEDRLNVRFGNPDLQPETSSQYEIGYSAFKNGKVLNLSVFYRNTNDLIQAFTTIDNGISNNTYENLGTDKAIGFNVFASTTVAKILTLRSNINYNTFKITSEIPGVNLERSGSRYNMFFQAALDLKKDWKVESFGFFNAPQQTLQGENPSFWMYSFGFRKDLWDKKGSIGFRAVDPFNATKRFETNLADESFRLNSVFNLPFRSFGVNFSYKIGSLKLQQRDRGPKNDDQKAGDGGGQQGGGQQGGK